MARFSISQLRKDAGAMKVQTKPSRTECQPCGRRFLPLIDLCTLRLI